MVMPRANTAMAIAASAARVLKDSFVPCAMLGDRDSFVPCAMLGDFARRLCRFRSAIETALNAGQRRRTLVCGDCILAAPPLSDRLLARRFRVASLMSVSRPSTTFPLLNAALQNGRSFRKRASAARDPS